MTDVVRVEVVVVSDGLIEVVDVVLPSEDDRVVEVVESVVVDAVDVVASVVELEGGTITEVDDSEVVVGDSEVLWQGEVSLSSPVSGKIRLEKLTSSSSLSKHRLHSWSCSPVE